MSTSSIQKALGSYERVLDQTSKAINLAKATNKEEDITAAHHAFETFSNSKALIEQCKKTAGKTKEQFTALEKRADALAAKYQKLITKEPSPQAKKAEEKTKGTFDKTPKGKKKAGKEDKKIDPKRVINFPKEIAKCERLMDAHFAGISKVAKTKSKEDAEALISNASKQEHFANILSNLEAHAEKADKATKRNFPN